MWLLCTVCITTHPGCQSDVDDSERYFVLPTGDEEAPRGQQFCSRSALRAGPAQTDLLHERTRPGFDALIYSEHVCKPLHVFPKVDELRWTATQIRQQANVGGAKVSCTSEVRIYPVAHQELDLECSEQT